MSRGDRRLSSPSDMWVFVCVCAVTSHSSVMATGRWWGGGRDNRHCRVDGGYKSLWLNLWMIGIRGARGRMCALRSDPAGHHASPLMTLLSSNRESETGDRPDDTKCQEGPQSASLYSAGTSLWRTSLKKEHVCCIFFLRCSNLLFFFFSLYRHHMNAALTDENTTAKQCRGLWYRFKMQLIKFQESMWWFWLHLGVKNSISSRATRA